MIAINMFGSCNALLLLNIHFADGVEPASLHTFFVKTTLN